MRFRSRPTKCFRLYTTKINVLGPRAFPRCPIRRRCSYCRRGRTATARRRSAMLRLPWFEYRAPRTVAEAAKILAGEGPAAMAVAGGTDLLPNMKRRHQAPKVLVSLRGIPELKALNGSFGAAGSLNEFVRYEMNPHALRQAASMGDTT